MAELRKVGDRFVAEAVELIEARARVAQADGGWFRLSLCGGSTPKAIYEALAASDSIDWARVRLTFGDERAVPPDHADSNYRMVRGTLLDRVPIPVGNVLRIEAEDGAAIAAERCEATLKAWAEDDGSAIFVHDLALLGMGGDGHTASLFPGTAALDETERWVVANYVPKFATERITFTYPLLNASRAVCFLVTGEDQKGPVVERILAGGADDPAARIDPAGELIWLLGW
jgi:6-phosphogluconolactonase